MSGVREQLRSLQLEPSPPTKPPADTPSPGKAAAAKRAGKPASGSPGTGTGKARTRKPAPEKPARAGAGTGGGAGQEAGQGQGRAVLEVGNDPELYLLQQVGREELERVGKPLNLGNPPAYLREAIDAHCDRKVMPIRTLIFALLDRHAREMGWLGEEPQNGGSA